MNVIYFCSDDYGVSKESNDRIERCIKEGVVNKVSVLPNGEITDFKERLSAYGVKLSLHLNLVEGYPLSNQNDVGLLLNEKGCFRYSFIGLLLLSLSSKRKKLQQQLYREIKSQLQFWKQQMGDEGTISIDSHQHTHMIPLVFHTLMQVILDEGLQVDYLRIPTEPVLPYLTSPDLYFSYPPSGLLKQWLLNFFAVINRREFQKLGIPTPYFMGAVFSGRLNEENVRKILPKYRKLAEKKGKHIEIGFHPGYMEPGETLMEGTQKSFQTFYFSKRRKMEYDALMNLKSGINKRKEG